MKTRPKTKNYVPQRKIPWKAPWLLKSSTVAFLPRDYMKWFDLEVLEYAVNLHVQLEYFLAEQNKK